MPGRSCLLGEGAVVQGCSFGCAVVVIGEENSWGVPQGRQTLLMYYRGQYIHWLIDVDYGKLEVRKMIKEGRPL